MTRLLNLHPTSHSPSKRLCLLPSSHSPIHRLWTMSYPTNNHASRPKLSLDTISQTTMSPRKGPSPVKSSTSAKQLYDLPQALDSPTFNINLPRARPGGFGNVTPTESSRGYFDGAVLGSGSRSQRDGSMVSPRPGYQRTPSDRPRRSTSREDSLPPVVTPGGSDALDEKVRLFKHHCRLFYLSPNPPQSSASYISSALSSATPQTRTVLTKAQSSIRALAHLHHLRIRITSLHALITTTRPSGSLSLASRSALTSPDAKAERRAKLESFVDKWRSGSSGGVEPFFRGLWAMLRVQSRGDAGGAGSRRMIWEINDAVFMESGGPEFMSEAVNLLKGILGFTDQPLAETPSIVLGSSPSGTPYIGPGQYPAQELATQEEQQSLLGPRQPEATSIQPWSDDDLLAQENVLNEPRFRLWIFPAHITDQEAASLISLFPPSIAKKKDIRLPYTPPGHGAQGTSTLETNWKVVHVGGRTITVPDPNKEAHEGVLHHGTGRMWIGLDERDEGWNGSAWFRFVRWFLRLFGLA